MNNLKKCGFCQQPADLMCSRCLEVYCSVVCQIRDWSEHKKICVPIPKLYRNDSYFDLLSGGMAPPARGSFAIDQMPHRTLNNNARSLKPLRKPNVTKEPTTMLTVEPETPVKITVEEKNPEVESSKTVPNITITKDSEKRMATMSIVDITERCAINDTKPLEPQNDSPQTMSNLKMEITQNHRQIMEKVEAIAASAKTTKQSEMWMLNFPIEKATGEMFDAVVQFVVTHKPNRCWVISADHEAQCDKLLRDINGQVNPNAEPLKFDEVQVNDICTGPYLDIYYRAVILEKVDQNESLVKIRLIDYGNELILPVSDLRAPLPLMRNLRAFAFMVEIQNLNRPLELMEVIRISIVGTKEDRKIVKIDNAPLSLLHLLSNSDDYAGEGVIVSTLSKRKALVMLSSPSVTPIMKLLYTQLPKAASRFPLAEQPQIGDMICVEMDESGWSRALIIGQHEDNLLIFTVDNGTVDLVKTQDCHALPDLYKHKPWLLLFMEIRKEVLNEQEFNQKCFMPTFQFTFEQLAFNKAQRIMECMIKDAEGKRELAKVAFADFVCDLKKLGISSWQDTPQDKSIVKISTVLDISNIIVYPKGKLNVFTELLQAVMPRLKRVTKIPNVKELVIAVDDLMMPYRAQVLSNSSETEVEVLDLDNGIIKKCTLDKLYETNDFVSNLPVYTRKVRLLDMNVSAVQDHVSIIDQLDAFRSEKREFKMQFEGGSYIYGVKLIDTSSNRSLATILIENHDNKIRESTELAKKKQEEAKAQQQLESAKMEQTIHAATKPKVFTINDLELVALPAGKSGVKLNMMDDSDIAQGVMTVCEITKENLARYNTLNDEVNKFANQCTGDGYSPKLDELCLAIYDSDNLWYRAVCIKPMPESDTFVVQFIDYGNVASVKRESIRVLPKELNFPCAAHICIIKDHTAAVPIIYTQISILGHMVPQEIEAQGDIYSLKF